MKYYLSVEMVVEMTADNEETAAEDFMKWINIKNSCSITINTSTIEKIIPYINDVEEV